MENKSDYKNKKIKRERIWTCGGENWVWAYNELWYVIGKNKTKLLLNS